MTTTNSSVCVARFVLLALDKMRASTRRVAETETEATNGASRAFYCELRIDSRIRTKRQKEKCCLFQHGFKICPHTLPGTILLWFKKYKRSFTQNGGIFGECRVFVMRYIRQTLHQTTRSCMCLSDQSRTSHSFILVIHSSYYSFIHMVWCVCVCVCMCMYIYIYIYIYIYVYTYMHIQTVESYLCPPAGRP